MCPSSRLASRRCAPTPYRSRFGTAPGREDGSRAATHVARGPLLPVEVGRRSTARSRAWPGPRSMKAGRQDGTTPAGRNALRCSGHPRPRAGPRHRRRPFTRRVRRQPRPVPAHVLQHLVVRPTQRIAPRRIRASGSRPRSRPRPGSSAGGPGVRPPHITPRPSRRRSRPAPVVRHAWSELGCLVSLGCPSGRQGRREDWRMISSAAFTGLL